MAIAVQTAPVHVKQSWDTCMEVTHSKQYKQQAIQTASNLCRSLHDEAGYVDKSCSAVANMTGTIPPEIFYALPDLQFIVLGTNTGEPVL